ncbi:ABC transporter permease [Flexivirga oryzae]|uniref:Iron(III) transport system permease protein n=1 Tax=Flexivirga oryzae TaxID=1794944 RepID=A0A839N569_9MICO|nr:iron ABC transporter permease [Flexivirga oryzae]MBB2891899.1 iron(III) transport system permease protein [Flexivirga oryzae]
MLVTAFRNGELGDPGSSFSTSMMQKVYTTATFRHALLDTFKLAVSVSILATAIGAVLAWLVNRTDAPLAKWMGLFVIAPLFASPFLGAVAWQILGSPNVGLINEAVRLLPGVSGSYHLVNINTLPGIIFVQTVYYIPYSYLFIVGSITNMDPGLEEASAINGGGIFRTATRVTFPIIRPAVLSALFFIFILSADEFAIPDILRPDIKFNPLSVVVYQFAQSFPINLPGSAAAGTMLLILTVLGMILYSRATRASNRFVTVTARGFRQRRISLGPWRWLGTIVCCFYLLIAIILPYASLLYSAFTRYLTPNILKAHYTASQVQSLVTSSPVLSAMKNTVIVAVIAPTICGLLALCIGYTTRRLRYRGSSILTALGTLPVAVPGIVFGTGMLLFYIHTPLYGTISVIVIAFIALYLPQALRVTETGLSQIDPALEESSAVCGASIGQTLLRITGPLLRPSLLSVWILVFIYATREISAAVMLYGPDSTVLSVMTFSYLATGNTQNAAIIGLLQTLIMIVGIVVARFVLRVRLTSQVQKGGV